MDNKLQGLTDEELESEISKRRIAHQQKEKIIVDVQQLTEFKKRQPCVVMGMCYGKPGDHAVGEQEMATVTIPGNCSWTYRVTASVCRDVHTYFHNFWDEYEYEFKLLLQNDVDKFVRDRLNDPLIIVKIACGVIHSLDNPEREKELVDRLSLFTVEQLTEARKKLRSEWRGSKDDANRFLRMAIAIKQDGVLNTVVKKKSTMLKV